MAAFALAPLQFRHVFTGKIISFTTHTPPARPRQLAMNGNSTFKNQSRKNFTSHHVRHRNPHGPQQEQQTSRAGDKVLYHVLNARPILDDSSPRNHNQHLQMKLQYGSPDSPELTWATINVRAGSDDVFYSINDNYQHPITAAILDANLGEGYTSLESQEGGIALDYIRQKLVDLSSMDTLRQVLDGEEDPDDISDAISTIIANVFREQDARLFLFGSRFEDDPNSPKAASSPYGLSVGIHDIHMNQGSMGAHAGSNGIYRDGGVLAYFPSDGTWTSVFLKFASQAETTDDNGNSSA